MRLSIVRIVVMEELGFRGSSHDSAPLFKVRFIEIGKMKTRRGKKDNTLLSV